MTNEKSADKNSGAVPKVAHKPNPPGRPGNVAGGRTNPGAQKGATSIKPTGRNGR